MKISPYKIYLAKIDLPLKTCKPNRAKSFQVIRSLTDIAIEKGCQLAPDKNGRRQDKKFARHLRFLLPDPSGKTVRWS
jgi:hypothetical protein